MKRENKIKSTVHDLDKNSLWLQLMYCIFISCTGHIFQK